MKRASSTTVWSFTPRFTTASILIGVRPAASAASMPSITRATGKPTSFIARNTVSSSESSETLTRFRPASASGFASSLRREPLVVIAMSMSGISASIATNFGSSARSVGSPPVSRTFCTPRPAKMRASRVISSKLRIWSRGRNAKSEPKTSFGMQ